MFNHHPSVHRSALVGVNGQPVIIVELEPGKKLTALLREELQRLAATTDKTANINTFLAHLAFPDVGTIEHSSPVAQ